MKETFTYEKTIDENWRGKRIPLLENESIINDLIGDWSRYSRKLMKKLEDWDAKGEHHDEYDYTGHKLRQVSVTIDILLAYLAILEAKSTKQ